MIQGSKESDQQKKDDQGKKDKKLPKNPPKQNDPGVREKFEFEKDQRTRIPEPKDR